VAWRVEDRKDRDAFRFSGATHRVTVAVRQHDHVAALCPVPLPAADRDPAFAVGYNVKQNYPFSARMKHVRCLRAG
jgi:hypothetical protein